MAVHLSLPTTRSTTILPWRPSERFATSKYNPESMPGPEYSLQMVAIANNVFAYNFARGGITLWNLQKMYE